MKTLRKFMMGASVGALALIAVGGVNAKASAPTVSFENNELKLSAAGYVSYDAVDKKGALNAKAKWDAYDATDTGTNVDLSTLKTTKESYIAVKTFGETAVSAYKMSAYNPKVKGKYAVESGKGKITLEGGADGDTYEYRTQFGNWQEYKESEFKLAKYEQQGTTLYFRVKASTFKVTAGTAKEGEDLAVGTIEGHLPSKEFKVKIGKKANGPSVKVDYVKATVSAKKAEFRTSATGTFADLPEAGQKLTLTAAGSIEIRTKAEGKKTASKTTLISFPKSDAPVAADITATVTKNEWDTAKKQAKTGKGTVKFENKSKKTIAIYVDGTAKAIATIKAGASVTVSEKKFTAKKDVTAVFAADAKAGVFQSPAFALQTGGYDFAAEEPSDK